MSPDTGKRYLKKDTGSWPWVKANPHIDVICSMHMILSMDILMNTYERNIFRDTFEIFCYSTGGCLEYMECVTKTRGFTGI